MRSNDDRKKETWLALQRIYAIERYNFLVAAERDPEIQAWARRVVFSPEGFWFFARTFGTIHEPRKLDTGHGFLPFIPFVHQEWAAQFFFSVYEDGDVGMALKTRDMGISWIVYHQLAWMWLTDGDAGEGEFSALLGSKIEDLVDKSAGKLDKDTMFGRLEIIIDNLPAWLKPVGFDLDSKDQRQKHWWRNPENGNMFVGESSTGTFGRQRRHSLGVLDEFDFWEDAAGAITAARDSCGALWLITTPNEKGEQTAKRIVDEDRARILELPWEYHPYKTREWYEQTRKRRFDEGVATELDLSWEGSRQLLIYPEYARCPKGKFPWRPDWPTYAGIDFGRSDGTALVYLQQSPLSARIRAIAAHYRANEPIDHFLPYMGGPLISGAEDYSTSDLELIERSRMWHRSQWGVEWYGDPAGRQRTSISNQSVLDILHRHGIYVATNTRAISHEDRQSAARTVIRRMDVNMPDCAILDRAATRYKRPPAGPTQTAERRNRPVHNFASHPWAAFEYIAVNMQPPQEKMDEDTGRHKAAWE